MDDAPSADELCRQLEQHVRSHGLPDDLVKLVRPARWALREDSGYRRLYEHHDLFWANLSLVWESQAESLQEGHSEVVPSLTAVAALTASLCANSPSNQLAVLNSVEPHLRRVLSVGSSFVHLQDFAYVAMTRSCCQVLSNMVTGNEPVAQSYLLQRLKDEESDHLIQRLLTSSDSGILQAVLMFLLNSLHESADRALLLATSSAGASWLDRITVLAGIQFDHEDEIDTSEDEGESAAVFDLAFALVNEMIRLGAFVPILERLEGPDRRVSPAQIILLKFLDAFLARPPGPDVLPPSTFEFLAALLRRTTSSLVRDQDKDSSDALMFQAAVLLLHCLASLGLASGTYLELLSGSVEDIVSLLSFSNSLPERRTAGTATQQSVQPEYVAQLKRTCVRLLGIASFEQRPGQDAIREAGGISLLLNLCQINDANLTLREHALLAVRNVLKNNATNQELISQMKPEYLVGPNGELQDLPPAMRVS